jgi:hypothetical protein
MHKMILVDCTSSYFSESFHLPETKQAQTIFEIIERTKKKRRREKERYTHKRIKRKEFNSLMKMDDVHNRTMLPVKVNVFDQEIQQMDLHKNDYADQMMNLLVDELVDFHKKNKLIEMDLMHNVHYL